MIKPFDSKELVARVKAVLRRFQPEKSSSSQNSGKIVEYPDLIVNQTNYSVIYKGSTVDMPPKELELLYFLASSPNQVFTREQLLDHIWGYEYIGDTRTVDVHIKRLREKIKGNDSWALTTVWGIGYKLRLKTYETQTLPKLILAWICFAVLSFVSVAGITSSLVEKHLIKNRTEGMYREANVIAAGRLAQNYTERASLQDTYTNLLAVASYQSMRLWLMDSNGKILIDTAVGYDQSKITQLDSFDPVSLSGNYYQTGRFF